MSSLAAEAAAIPRREPIIDEVTWTSLSEAPVDSEWGDVTGLVLQAIQQQGSIRERLAPFVQTPVGETLPQSILDAAFGESGSHDQARGLTAQAYPSLTRYLAVPPIPDEEIGQTLRGFDYLITPEDSIRVFIDEGIDENFIRAALKTIAAQGTYMHGVSDAEAELIAAPTLELARDARNPAALAAALLIENVQLNEHGLSLTRADGLKVGVTPDCRPHELGLLDPQTWQGRKQIEDRTYEAYAGNRKYLLKEHKTTRHRNTPVGVPEIEGHPSEQEFAIAQEFQAHGTRKGEVNLRWERPIGFVEFPDGFQFIVYEFQAGLIDREEARPQLAATIRSHQDQYFDEYEAVWGVTGCTFEEFSRAKARQLIDQAEQLVRDTPLELEYKNRDDPQYGLLIDDQDGEMTVSAFGYDFEYFTKQTAAYLENERQLNTVSDENHAITVRRDGIGRGVSEFQNTAYIALLDRETSK